MNGTRPDQIGYNLDGADNEDLMSNTNNPFPFPDALQEFSVQTNSFDAQYGNNAGAVVNVVTKSGTNSWHGDAFEFVRNRVFNATQLFCERERPAQAQSVWRHDRGSDPQEHHLYLRWMAEDDHPQREQRHQCDGSLGGQPDRGLHELCDRRPL